MVLHSAKHRIRQASLDARSAGPGQFARCALELYLELLPRANNVTGIATPRPGELDAALSVSRWTLARAARILEAAGVVTVSFRHNRRGYRCGLSYTLTREPAATGEALRLCGTTEQKSKVFAPTPLPPMGHRRPGVAAPMVHGCYRRKELDLSTSKKSSTSTGRADAPPAPVCSASITRTRPKEAATFAQACALVRDVLRLDSTLTDEADLADAVKNHHVAMGFTYDPQQVRHAIAAVRRPHRITYNAPAPTFTPRPALRERPTVTDEDRAIAQGCIARSLARAALRSDAALHTN